MQYAYVIFKHLQEMMNFQFEFTIPPDKLVGNFEDGKWSGMVGQLTRGEADVTVKPLAVTK